MNEIDYTSWPRRQLFEFFSPLSNPYYSVSFRLDVTELRSYCRKERLSFYYALCYLVTHAVNEVEAFSFALEDGKVVKLPPRKPSFTDKRPGEEFFRIVTLPCEGSMADFCRAAAEKSAAQQSFIDLASEGKDLIYLTCLPWLDLTALTNEREASDRDDAIPRIGWGKYIERDGRLELGMSVEVNHRFIDGGHIGAFAEALRRAIAALEG